MTEHNDPTGQRPTFLPGDAEIDAYRLDALASTIELSAKYQVSGADSIALLESLHKGRMVERATVRYETLNEMLTNGRKQAAAQLVSKATKI